MRKFFLTSILAGVVFFSAQASTPVSALPGDSISKANVIENLLTFANQHLHSRYRSGGISPKGFDCSGFVRYCFQKVGTLLPHSSAAQGLLGKGVKPDEVQPGDLIFFKGSSTRGNRIGHVGIITEVSAGTIRFIHSAWNGGVRYDQVSSAYYQRRFMGIRRVVELITD